MKTLILFSTLLMGSLFAQGQTELIQSIVPHTITSVEKLQNHLDKIEQLNRNYNDLSKSPHLKIDSFFYVSTGGNCYSNWRRYFHIDNNLRVYKTEVYDENCTHAPRLNYTREYSFDNANRVKSFIHIWHHFATAPSIHKSKMEYSYDYWSRLIKEEFFYYDTTNQQFVPSFIYHYSYAPNGKIGSWWDERFQTGTGIVSDSFAYHYDSLNRLSEYQYYTSFNQTNLHLSLKQVCTYSNIADSVKWLDYDNQGISYTLWGVDVITDTIIANKIYQKDILYRTNTNPWTLYTKREKVRKMNGKLLGLTTYNYDTISMQFVPYNKLILKHDSYDDVNKMTNYQWNKSTQSWRGSSKYIFNHDSLNDKSEYSLWPEGLEEWVINNGNDDVTLNGYHVFTTAEGYAWDTIANEWTLANNMQAFYSGCALSTQDPEKQSIKIYPNPASDEVIIEGAVASDGFRLSIYDLTGRLMLDKNGVRTGKIKVAGLPSGVYVYVLQSEHQKHYGRLVIAR